MYIQPGIEKIVRYATSPLHYFLGLTLLMVLGIISLSAWSNLQNTLIIILLVVFACVIVLSLAIVAFFLFYKPHVMTFTKEEHYKIIRNQLGDSDSGEKVIVSEAEISRPVLGTVTTKEEEI